MTLPQLLAIAAGIASIILVLIDNERIAARSPPTDATEDTPEPQPAIRLNSWDEQERYIRREKP
jgi:hypothetical protein